MIIAESVYLDHHGVKGQRWGVRRAIQRSRETRAAADRANAQFLLDRAKLQTQRPGLSRGRAAREASDKANAQFLKDRAAIRGKNLTQEEALKRIKRGRKVAVGIISVWGAATIGSAVLRGLANA